MPGAEHEAKPPPAEAWERAPILEPVPGPSEPALISDGGGLPFEPARAYQPASPLDRSDPAVSALLAEIDRGRRLAQPARLLRPRARPAPLDAAERLAGWRELARTDTEALFGQGTPPRLVTVAVKRGLRNRWSSLGASNARPLRAVRAGVRASSWRLDPSFDARPGATELRVLVTEQTLASGTPAADRLLEPEIYLDDARAVLRMYVRPLEGYVGRSAKRETPVIVRLPEPLGDRELTDGALYEPPVR